MATHWNIANSYYLFTTNPTDTTPPTTPTNLVSGNVRYNNVNLTWDKSSENMGQIMYQIFRNNTLLGVVYGDDTVTTKAYFTDSTVTGSTAYTYYVTATDDHGNTITSNVINVTTPITDTVPPTTPTNVKVVANSDMYTISWDPSTDVGTGLKSISQVATI